MFLPSPIIINIPGKPLPWKAPILTKDGRAFDHRYDFKKRVKAIVRSQYKGPLLEGAVQVQFLFAMPIPVSTSNKKKNLMLNGEIYHKTRPDATNLQKLYEDCLIGIVIKDDNVVIPSSKKIYSDKPNVCMVITPLEDN